MKMIYKAGFGLAALLITSYLAFSSVIFFDGDSGNSNERWVPAQAAQPQGAAASPVQTGSLEAVYSAITASLVAGEFDKLITTANAAIETYPKDAQLLYFRGFARLQTNRHDDAIRDFTAALDLSPTHADAYRFRAQAHMAKGDHDRAIADADKACALQPNNAESYVIRAMAHLTKGDVVRAKPDVAKILQLDPNNAKAKILVQQLEALAKTPAPTATPR